jgi:hypothetical protein
MGPRELKLYACQSLQGAAYMYEETLCEVLSSWRHQLSLRHIPHLLWCVSSCPAVPGLGGISATQWRPAVSRLGGI